MYLDRGQLTSGRLTYLRNSPQVNARMRLYGWGEEVESNAIEVHVHHLRKKLYPELIQTVRGVGYMVPKR